MTQIKIIPKLSFSCLHVDSIIQYVLENNNMIANNFVRIAHPHITRYKNIQKTPHYTNFFMDMILQVFVYLS